MKEWWNKIITTKFHVGWVFFVLILLLIILGTKLAQLIS